MTFYTDICGAQRMNPKEQGDPLTFPPNPPAGLKFFPNPLKYLYVDDMD